MSKFMISPQPPVDDDPLEATSMKEEEVESSLETASKEEVDPVVDLVCDFLTARTALHLGKFVENTALVLELQLHRRNESNPDEDGLEHQLSSSSSRVVEDESDFEDDAVAGSESKSPRSF